MEWVFAAAAVFLCVGAGLLIEGIRGRRINDHPICRACGFDLFGLSAGAGPCPECGMALDQPNAVRIGERRRRRGAIAIGSLAMLLGAGLIALGALGAASKINWNTYKPTWMLMAQADGWLGRAGSGVLQELWRRSTSGLSDQDLRVLAARALRVQADRQRAWTTEWGELYMVAHKRNLVTDAERLQFLQGALTVRAESRRRVRTGVGFSVTVRSVGAEFFGRSAPGAVLTRGSTTEYEVVRDGKVVETGGHTMDRSELSRRSWAPARFGGFGVQAQCSQSPGDYLLRSKFTLNVTLADANGHSDGWMVAYEDERPLTLTPPDQPTVVPVEDSATLQALTDGLQLQVSEQELIDERSRRWALKIDTPEVRTPIHVAFSVTIRLRDGERAGAFERFSHSFSDFASGGRKSGHLNARPPCTAVDLILTPSCEAAEGTFDVTEVWDGAIVYENVPLTSGPNPARIRPSRVVSPAPKTVEELFTSP